MSTHTDFLNLELPAGSDYYNVGVTNANFQKLAAFLASLNAEQIAYLNSAMEGVQNVKQALDYVSANKVNAESPVLTGTPTAPTAAITVNNTQIATTGYVQNVSNYRTRMHGSFVLSLGWDAEPGIALAEMLVGESNVGRILLDAKAIPKIDNGYDLGSGSRRWRDIYAGTGTINTSDRRQKKDISKLDKIKKFFMSLNPVMFRFNDGDSNRIHHGLIAQEVEEAMTANGLSSVDFAGLIKTPNEENEGEYIYGLRYTEFIPMLIKMVQEQQSTIDGLTARIETLEAK